MDDAVRLRLEEARKRKAAREQSLEEAAVRRELDELELEEKLAVDLSGQRGTDFEILNTEHGLVAIKIGEAVLYKRFQAAVSGGKDPSPEDVLRFVSTCVVFPEVAEFHRLVSARPVLGVRCANALVTLYGAREEGSRSKF